MADWFVRTGLGEQGPFTSSQLKQQAASGQITAETQVRRNSEEPWYRAGKIKGLEFRAEPDPEDDIPVLAELSDSQAGPNAAERRCPFCAELIQAQAVKCRFCGEFLNRTLPAAAPVNHMLLPLEPGAVRLPPPTQSQPVASRPGYLVHVCDKQKMVIWAVLFGLVFGIPLLLLTAIVPPLGLLASLAYLVFRLVVAIQLGTAVYRQELGIILGLVTVVPFLGWLMLVVINVQATSILQAAGVRVGLLGGNRKMAAQADLQRTPAVPGGLGSRF